ncbi:hypothetical protein OHA_1_03855 [Pleomorphomonas sp. SM30]|uniref:Uncharacterized protein n=2 Tax=Oharaeibacter diazotrophicus TaxID=1920512 RepID=A0A4R6RG94_9HYPH|nr:hypothetical protein EDD54_2105 [Oharaeibacter diazotrophicus]BBE74225.1 hypothetical protein OHA_1_03855 [Pleomorphomonas sp. SM30]GLS76087.1 hypothetical protein GCM10007904_14220 [Oharaeibacter diazotrophicus]
MATPDINMATPDNGISNDALASAERSETLLEWNVPSFRRLSLADAEFNPGIGGDGFGKSS